MLAHARTQTCVLVVDDDARSRKLMTIMLGKSGFRVVAADSGAQGLGLLDAERPDIVIVDLLMPGMDGLEFCRRVRKMSFQAGPPIVLSTAMASSQVADEARRAGVDAVLMKPFERNALLQVIDTLVGSGSAHDG